MEKMQNLFIQHLRIINDSERVISNVLSLIAKNTTSKQLQMFCEIKLEEKMKIRKKLKKIFELMKVDPEGGKDDIIRSMLMNTDMIRYNEKYLTKIATIIFGRTTNVYLLNGYRTAVSCAMELNDENVLELLSDCLNETKFDKECFAFLNRKIIINSENKILFHNQIAAA